MALARQLAPHVRKQGEKLLPESVTKKGGGGASKVDDALEVAAGGLQGTNIMATPSDTCDELRTALRQTRKPQSCGIFANGTPLF